MKTYESKKRRRRGGVAVTDFLLATVIGIAAMTGVYYVYQTVRGDTPLITAANQVKMLKQFVQDTRSVHGNAGKYAGLQTSDVVSMITSNTSLLPRDLVRNGQLTNAYGGSIDVRGCDNGKCGIVTDANVMPLRFMITIYGPPKGDCQDLAMWDMGPDLRGMHVGITQTNNSNKPLTIGQARISCGTGSNYMSWVFK